MLGLNLFPTCLPPWILFLVVLFMYHICRELKSHREKLRRFGSSIYAQGQFLLQAGIQRHASSRPWVHNNRYHNRYCARYVKGRNAVSYRSTVGPASGMGSDVVNPIYNLDCPLCGTGADQWMRRPTCWIGFRSALAL